MVDPASHQVLRAWRYSRPTRTRHLSTSPTGLSPAPAGRSRTVQLSSVSRARGRLPPPALSSYPTNAAPTSSYALVVWAPPVSLAATPGILSLPRGTEMFQFPRFPPPPVRCAVLQHHPEGVAPFGYLWITSCQHFPRAFRRVAASFLGCRRQGIHRLPFFADFPACDAAPPSPTRANLAHLTSFSTVARVIVLGSFSCMCAGSTPMLTHLHPPVRVFRARTPARAGRVFWSPRRQVASLPRLSKYRQRDSQAPVRRFRHLPVEPRGLEPRTSAVQGRRSPS